MSVIQSMASAAQQLFGNTTIESLQHSWLSFATDEKSVRVIYMLLMLVVMLAGLIRMAKTTSFSRGWKIGLQCTYTLLVSLVMTILYICITQEESLRIPIFAYVVGFVFLDLDPLARFLTDTRLVTFGEKIKALEKDKTLMLQELEATRGAVRVLYGMNQNQYDARILALERQKIMSEIRMKRGARAGEDMEAQDLLEMPTHLLEHNAHVKKSASITKEIKTLENRVEYLDRYMNLLALGFASQECQIAQVFDVSPAVSSLLQEKDPQTEQAVPG